MYTYIQEINEIIYEEYFNLLLNQKQFFLWDFPERDYSFFSFGNIFSINENSYKKINQLKHIHNFEESDFSFYPLFVGGIKFPVQEKTNLWSDYPSEIWFVPEISFIKYRNNYYFAFNFVNDFLNEQPEKVLEEKLKNILNSSAKFDNKEYDEINDTKINDWNIMVSAALSDIKSGDLEKVVLARIKKVSINEEINLIEIIKKLKTEFPECYVFAWRNNNSVFFGATPELLGRISQNKFETDALAGSINRGINDEEDYTLENKLLNDSKNIREHNAVLKFIVENLSRLSESVNYGKTKIKKLKNIQHLWTPINAKVRKDTSIISLIKSIYPTPAICGLPKEKALKQIEKLEIFDRGLYAGILGWFNLEGNGEFAVGIRSALYKNSFLYAFAGCGIVEGSEIKSEFEETELKLKPILSLFREI
ncbi:MAG: isochorismate synthase [Melioribacteraceae bacterium]